MPEFAPPEQRTAKRDTATADHAAKAVPKLEALEKAVNAALHATPRAGAGATKPVQRRPATAQDVSPAPVQRARVKPGGLPEPLKSGIEALSGLSMEDVRVHPNSSEPAKLGAHATAQGNQIHLSPGQDHHLPHEAWHVVQQAQGRVRPSFRLGATAINDSPALESEADRMGAKALQAMAAPGALRALGGNDGAPVQRMKLAEYNKIKNGLAKKFPHIKELTVSYMSDAALATALKNKYNFNIADIPNAETLENILGSFKPEEKKEEKKESKAPRKTLKEQQMAANVGTPTPLEGMRSDKENNKDLNVPQKMIRFVDAEQMKAGMRTIGAGPCVILGMIINSKPNKTFVLAHFDSETDVDATGRLLSPFAACGGQAYLAGGNEKDTRQGPVQGSRKSPIFIALEDMLTALHFQVTAYPTSDTCDTVDARLDATGLKKIKPRMDPLTSAERTIPEGLETIPQSTPGLGNQWLGQCQVVNEQIGKMIATLGAVDLSGLSKENLKELSADLDDCIETYRAANTYMAAANMGGRYGLLFEVHKNLENIAFRMRQILENTVKGKK